MSDSHSTPFPGRDVDRHAARRSVSRRRALLLLVALVSLAVAPAGRAQQGGVSPADHAAGGRWVQQRVRLARRGHADRVSLPVAYASNGWGCACPSNFVGTTPDVEEGAWLSVTLAEGVTEPTFGYRGGAAFLVEGYFSGGVSHYHSEDGPIYLLYELVVTRIVRRLGSAAAEPPMRVLAAAAYSCTSIVKDPDPPLNVHRGAGLRTPVVGQLANDTVVGVDDVRDDWIHVTAPTPGWAWGENVHSTCAAPQPGDCCREGHP